MPPTNVAEMLSFVVPVLPIIGRFQPTALAATAEVPPPWSSLLSPTASVLARPSGTACSQAASLTGIGLPVRSVTEAIGVGGHHTPPLRMVAATLPSSRPLSGLKPRVNAPVPGQPG